MNWRRSASAVFAFGLLAAITIGPTTSAADPTLLATASPNDQAPDDVVGYMEYHGVTRQVADIELAELPLVAALQDQLAKDSPDEFGGLWITHQPSYGVVVGLVDASPGTAERLARELGVRSRVDQVAVAHSLAELVATADDLRSRRMKADHTIKVDIRLNRVVIRVLEPQAYLARADGKAARAIGATIEQVPELGGATIYAGLPTPTCTLGFSVRKTGTTIDGITTAAHCQNVQSYNGTDLPFRAASNGSADAQWHDTPGFVDEPRMRVDSSGSTRTLASRTFYSQVIVGQTICKYGKTTDYGCGEVEEKEADAPWVPNQTGRYISLKRCNTDLSTDGDSGGPVFFNYSAFGIISGWQFGGLACHDELVFGSVSYLENNLNLTVKTQ